eukprot:TRINITY_DN74231_c0_g1_i1.p1 TRINITY_DN74231_c0_g1~~TRINITY_DN74231_c0_g1_i1.p1  ORF type:complete len:466 (+),score=74.56 TRINITY_DN74231_c0_g1_i1:91-1488(+)
MVAIMGFDLFQIQYMCSALFWNVLDSVLNTLRLSSDSGNDIDPEWDEYCVAIERPGAIQQLKFKRLQPNQVTFGYNLTEKLSSGGSKSYGAPKDSHINGLIYTHKPDKSDLPANCVVIKTSYFSVNYADVCIRWGLYESQVKFVGWPVVPGFDVSGVVSWVGQDAASEYGFKVGDHVVGATFFGAYSSQVLIPGNQLRKIPLDESTRKPCLSLAQAAALPAVSVTAVHALHCAGFYPEPLPSQNRDVLIHSAAGGVGSLLVVLAQKLGARNVVGVVGRPEKVKALQQLQLPREKTMLQDGSAVVVPVTKDSLWKRNTPTDAEFAAIFDANGVATFSNSYNHLARNGRMVIYGVHTNLPMGGFSAISLFHWLRMGLHILLYMPSFDPLKLIVESRTVSGFNLSFFAYEVDRLSMYFNSILGYVQEGLFAELAIDKMPMKDIRKAHEKLSSGTTCGKIVLEVRASSQ